ncbi:putative lipoprotein [Mycobacterium xenopi 4042]|uniref:Putative lipoprotein n=1 Tax=Mycobacterium xenopi 4042 TaxID=1299334 RepID=X8BG49_MYCXE|nr:putative lipoprotein [Mycobacterium xenopi 4042]
MNPFSAKRSMITAVVLSAAGCSARRQHGRIKQMTRSSRRLKDTRSS